MNAFSEERRAGTADHRQLTATRTEAVPPRIKAALPPRSQGAAGKLNVCWTCIAQRKKTAKQANVNYDRHYDHKQAACQVHSSLLYSHPVHALAVGLKCSPPVATLQDIASMMRLPHTAACLSSRYVRLLHLHKGKYADRLLASGACKVRCASQQRTFANFCRGKEKGNSNCAWQG